MAALGSAGACNQSSSSDQNGPATVALSRGMPDGKRWTTTNLNVSVAPSYCYDDEDLHCARYGRLYTWESAQRGCQSLGEGWRLPTDDEWRQLARHYGGLRDESADTGKAAHMALLAGGSSGFDALFGGGRSENGAYERLEAHGLYWSASESSPTSAWLYNFGKGGVSVSRHSGGNKGMALSVRCARP